MKIPLPKHFEPQKPVKIHDYQDITINIHPLNFKPSQCDLKNLYQKGIIPLHWQLKKSINKNVNSQQFAFEQGLGMILEKNKVTFVSKPEKMSGEIDFMINNFIRVYLNNNYQRLQVVMRRLISLPGDKNSGSKFLLNHILNPKLSKIKVLGHQPSKTNINISCDFSPCPLIITLTDVSIKTKEGKIKSALLFRGVTNSLTRQKNVLNNYQEYVAFFNKFIEDNFLCY